MACPHLDYRSADDDHEFDHERPYCGVLESFVSPMRADICNDRFEFDHTEDCPVFALHHDETAAAESEPAVEPDGPLVTEDDSSTTPAPDTAATGGASASETADVEAVVDGDGPESDGSNTD